MSASQLLLASHGPEDRWLTESPNMTYFEVKYKPSNNISAETYEVPFEQSAVYYGDSAICNLPKKGEFIRRFTVRSTLPTLYEPLGPGYVYPLYTDQVNGAVYIPDGTIAIQPGDFIGYFNTQFQGAWATNFVGYSNINVSYDSTIFKFVFTSNMYDYIYFPDDMSGVFWGFDPRSFDFITSGGYKAYRFTNGVLTPPFTLFQAGWIRGFTPPPATGFSYVDSVACKLIKSATLLIGGQTIDTLTSERLIIEDDIGVSYENQAGLAIMEGKGDTSQVYAPREYYTRLTFNTDKLNVKALYNQDVKVEIEYEKFENLPQKLITTKSLTDGGSYTDTNIKAVLGLPNNLRVYHTNFYKQWIVYVMDDPNQAYHQRYYFYDTTKPQGDASSWTYWYDPEFHQLGVVRPYFIGGTMYTCMYGTPYIRSVPVADMLTGTAVATQGATVFPGLYEGNISIEGLTADARYLYMTTYFRNVTFGSNTAYLYDLTPTGRTYLGYSGPATLTVKYTVLSISTPQLIASDNVALVNFVTTQSAGIAFRNITGEQVYPSSISILDEIKVGSDITANVVITYTGVVFIPYVPGFYINTTTTLSGSNVASFISCTPECAFANIVATYKVYNITTPYLIPSDNTAAINWMTNISPNVGGTTKTVTITSETKTLSNIFLTANVAYTYTSNGQPAPQVFENPLGNRNIFNPITVRYDTTKPIGLWSSYDFLSFPGTGAPKTWYDITGVFGSSFASFPPAFDGRNIYGTIGGTGLLLKTDTQNFLNLSSYTYYNVGLISPVPNLTGITYSQVPNATDGRYLYFQAGGFSGGSVYLTRYDSTQSISSASAYSSLLFTSSAFPDGYGIYPYGFDGKSIYYIGGTYGSIRASILRYDTTTNSVSDWIIFNGTGKAQTSKGTTVDTITWTSSYVAVISCLVSARYVYITETWGGGFETFNDLVQFDPLVMTDTLASSMIIKYETYDTPKPVVSQSLYGQTTVKEFIIVQGQSTGSFRLDVRGPVREFWVTVDSPGVIKQIVFRLNNEILVDDDQVMTRYIRTFESHTSMPSSSNVCVYSVSWDPERLAPSGTVNMSRIAEQFIDVTLTAQAPSNLTVRVYSKVFNVLAIQSGIGGLIFNS